MIIFAGDGKRIDMRDKMVKLGEQLTNPFIYVKNWIKGEVMDLESLLRAISKKESIESLKLDAMSKLKNDRATVDKMS